MSKYLPALLLGKSGHDLRHLQKNSSDREEPCGKHAEHTSHMQQDQPTPFRYSESTQNVPRIRPRLLASSHPSPLFFCSLGSSRTHFLFLKSQAVYFFAIALLQLGELPSSLYILVTSQMSPLQRDLPKLCIPGSAHTRYLTAICYFLPPILRK